MAASNKRPPSDGPDIEVDEGSTPRGMSPILIGLVATVVVLLALIFIVGRHDFGSAADDRLAANSLASAPDASPDAICASRSTYDLIRTALFRQAAQVRGDSQQAYEQLAPTAFVRMEAPVLTSQDTARGAVACSGSLTLELPPGLAVSGGGRVLTGEIDYMVAPAADGSGKAVVLGNAGPIVNALATLTRTASAAPQPAAPAASDMTDQLAPAPDDMPAADQPEPVDDQPAANPSFNCSNARTRSEIAVCTDVGLAALDRQMASLFNRAMNQADPQQQALLAQTRDSFLRYRDRCGTNSCIAGSYQGRIREIRDIMTGNWQPPR